MPSLELMVNVPIDDETAFTLEFAKFAAGALKKPLEYISTSVTYNKTLTFAGTLEPAFALTIVSLGNLGDSETNKGYSAAFSGFLEEKLKVKNLRDRGYITFHDPGNANLGYRGTHFGEIFGDKK
ncbi:Tautomerase/MIF superfamily [Mycena polygramma]|nr:Tautomerase/MIF superfamily [Mycena polygramma]